MAVGAAITLLVLVIDAAINSRNPNQTQNLAAGAWVDRVLPLIGSSTDEGQTVAGIWAHGLKTPGPALASSIDSVAAQAQANYQAIVKLRPPSSLQGPSGLLEAAFLARSEAATDLQQALIATLGAAAGPGQARHAVAAAAAASATPGASPATEAQLVSQAGADVQVGDSAYRLFLQSLPSSVGVRMPQSAWVGDMNPYTPQAATVFLASLQTAVVTTPVHQVQIYAVTLSPGPVSSSGGVQILPDASAVTVTIVLADTGNQPEDNLTVTAAVSPAGGRSSSVRDFVNLGAGQAYTISALGPLDPPQGPPVTLTVTVSPPAGSPASPATSTVIFSMPAPPPPTASTTAGTSTSTGTGTGTSSTSTTTAG